MNWKKYRAEIQSILECEPKITVGTFAKALRGVK